jgi:nucleoside-diphosphate-sugar epimerase
VKRAFVTGATGFVGAATVAALRERGYEVEALVRSDAAARAVEAHGARPVEGDLLHPGPWRAAAARADCVLHLAQPPTFGGRITRGRARRYGEERARMDGALFEALAGASPERVVYAAGTSYYGDLGPELRDESEEPRPRGFGPYVERSIRLAERFAERGAPLSIALLGHVYGDGSWYREYVLRPLRRGDPIYVVRGRSRHCSPVHLRDCARALAHLAGAAPPGRYFVVDDEPLPWIAFYERSAAALGKPLRLRTVPELLMRVLIGDVVTDSLLYDAHLSNARLRATGFAPEFPSSVAGARDVAARARP